MTMQNSYPRQHPRQQQPHYHPQQPHYPQQQQQPHYYPQQQQQQQQPHYHPQQPSQQIIAMPVAQQHPNNRPTNDPNYYDAMFNVKTREDDRTNRLGGNRNVIDYHLFAPKFQNHDQQDPSWQRPNHLDDTKRDQMNIFPTRMQDRRTPQSAQIPSSHPMQNRKLTEPIGQYSTKNERIDHFNRTVDSMHVPEDIQRPVATRDFARSSLDTNEREHDRDLVSERHFSLENLSGGLSLTGGGSFEDMFY